MTSSPGSGAQATAMVIKALLDSTVARAAGVVERSRTQYGLGDSQVTSWVIWKTSTFRGRPDSPGERPWGGNTGGGVGGGGSGGEVMSYTLSNGSDGKCAQCGIIEHMYVLKLYRCDGLVTARYP